MNCGMTTWFGAMNHAVLCWTHFKMPYSAQRFFSVTNVPSIAVRATEIWCSGQRRIPISRRSWDVIHSMWWYGRVWHQIIWLDLTFSMDRWMRHLIRNVGDVAHTLAERQRTPGWRVAAARCGTLRSFCAQCLNERFPGRSFGRGSPTSPTPLPWPPRSPDFTTPDNSFLVIIKGKVAARRYNNNNEDFRRAVEEAFRTITTRNSDICHTGHESASVCVSSIKVHTRIPWACNQGERKWFKSNYGSILVGVWWHFAHSVEYRLSQRSLC